MKPEDFAVKQQITDKEVEHYADKVNELLMRLCESNPLHMAIVANVVLGGLLEFIRNNSTASWERPK